MKSTSHLSDRIFILLSFLFIIVLPPNDIAIGLRMSSRTPVAGFKRREPIGKIFDKIMHYEGFKRTFLRSLNSEEPVHILLVSPPGQAKTLFLKCILETPGQKKVLFIIGGNASKACIIDALFDLRPKYLLVDEITVGFQRLACLGHTPLLLEEYRTLVCVYVKIHLSIKCDFTLCA